MNPANPANQGKWVAFEAIGYDVQNTFSRRLAAQDVITQLKQQLTDAPAIQGQTSTYGLRFKVKVLLRGVNGREGCLITVWQIDNGAETPRLITNWLEVYR